MCDSEVLVEGNTRNTETNGTNLSVRTKLSYAMGHVLNDICASMWFTYLLVYFQLVLGAGALRAGVLLLVGQVADAVATPFVGYHSDTSLPSKYGKRKSWHLFGTVCVFGAFPFIFSPCIGCASSHFDAQLVYYSAFVVIFQIGWASVQVSHLALIPELSPNDHQRTHLTALRYSFTVFSSLAVYLVTWLVLHVTNGSTNQIGPGDVSKFQHVVWMGLGVGGLTSLLFHCFLKEPPPAPIPHVHSHIVTHTSLLTKPFFYQMGMVYMCTRLFVNLNQVLVPLYLHSCLRLPGAALASVPLVSFLASFVASLLVQKLNFILGRKGAYGFGAMVGIAACVWLFFGSGPAYVSYQIYLVALLYGFGGAVMLVTSLGLTADLVGSATNTSAFVYGAMSFTDKLANGLAVILIQHLSEGSSSDFYLWAVALGCGVPGVVGWLSLLPPLRPPSEYAETNNKALSTVDEEEEIETTTEEAFSH